jgi:membrane-associated phospholipid phosphatase
MLRQIRFFYLNLVGRATRRADVASMVRTLLVLCLTFFTSTSSWALLQSGPPEEANAIGLRYLKHLACCLERAGTAWDGNFHSDGTALADGLDKQDEPSSISIKRVLLNLPGDQRAIWTAPFRLRPRSLAWVLPFAGTTGLLLASDQSNMAHERSNAQAIKRSINISNGGLAVLAGMPAAMYVWGSLNSSPRPRETGLLTAEALANSLIVSESLKRVFGRERPTATNGQGRFFHEFGDPSFPSDHSMLSWTAASVIAHEYPGWLSQALAYSAAGAVSVARVTGRKHFPTDVVVSGALGWMVGRQIYNRHHNEELDTDIGSFVPGEDQDSVPQTGTTFVPMDSWVYPVFDRLAAMGYLNTAVTGLRPWTRSECARLLKEAGEMVDQANSEELATSLYNQLAAEFAPEMGGQQTKPYARIEEAYTRVGFVSGQPLADDYHFAKTFVNDFGRPFGQGANAVTGASASTVVGPLAFYVRGEYQHAGTLPGQTSAVLQAIASADGAPFAFAPVQRTGSIDRVRALDAYASLNFHNNVISFGKQTLWWGPGADAPFLFSNNAEPLPLLRISRASPIVLPWIFRLLGAIRGEWTAGQLNGYQLIRFLDASGNEHFLGPPIRPHPFIQGEKISFKPTRNFEFGFGVTVVFSGPHFPLTLHNLIRSYSFGNTPSAQLNDPGDRRSAFDFSYRIPGLRNWLTLYSDSFTEDEFSPVSYPRKSAFRAGIYMPRLPKLPQIDLRVEGIYTDIPSLKSCCVSYFNTHYLSGYTNYGQIIGNAIGREGRGLNIWTTYRFSAQNSVQLHYRDQHVNPEFLKGGYLRDFDVSGTFVRAGSLVLSGSLKYEHWNFPLLSARPRSDISPSLQVSFRPVHGWRLFGRQ